MHLPPQLNRWYDIDRYQHINIVWFLQTSPAHKLSLIANLFYLHIHTVEDDSFYIPTYVTYDTRMYVDIF